jgi:DNA-binding GntR family transcriptional regulator
VLIEREICAGSHFFGSLSAPGRPPESLKEIEAILDALVNRDGPRAEELCRQHIDAAAAAILAAPGAQFRDS